MQQKKYWIVLRLRGGVCYESAVHPAVHETRESAETEAKRLAIKEGLGSEFVVFESMTSLGIVETPVHQTYHLGPEF